MVIYKATNLINNKCYIGLSTKGLERRKSNHLAQAKSNKLPYNYFHNALRKEGGNNFTWEIIANCKNRKDLISLEKLYIYLYRQNGTLYNLTDGGEGNFSKRTERTKQKLRIINTGKIQSEETKLKKSKAMKGRVSPMKGKKQTDHFKSVMKGRTPWNKGKKGVQTAWNKGLPSVINQTGERNPSYRHDVSDALIVDRINNGLSRKEIAIEMDCSQRTIDRRILKMGI